MVRFILGLAAAGLGLAGCAQPIVEPYDPLAAARAEGLIANVEARVPPQCYTRTGERSNPCFVCHTVRNGRNGNDDWELQARFDFTELARENRWRNLFADRRAAIAQISDAEIRRWIRQDNYSGLRRAMAEVATFPGWRPDLDYARGFDADGFAVDGSGWRAFRYKPFPGTFWPTNGSTDDVMIRLPQRFRQDGEGTPSRAIYQRNLAIVEAAIATPDTVPDAAASLPAHYEGAAADVPVHRFEYPVGTEFLHTVHYVDPAAPSLMSTRMKEVRYAIKRFRLDDAALAWRYAEEALERRVGGRPHYGGTAFTGQTNAFGWTFQGYIEDARGRLRLQTREEQLFCMGCHTGLGVTVDSTFALPRKVPGRAGWSPQRYDGIADTPQAGADRPEYLVYLARVGAGDELRANQEMLDRFFPGGVLDERAVREASAQGIAGLISPTPERALLLDKAYRVIVAAQSFALGRDALPVPALNVHERVADAETPLKASGHVFRDGRIWLDWPVANPAIDVTIRENP